MNPNNTFYRSLSYTINISKPLALISVQKNGTSNDKYKAFELLYDKYSPKMFGFILQHTTKKKAEEFLINIFLKIWNDIKSFESNTEEKILALLLLECRPILKK